MSAFRRPIRSALAAAAACLLAGGGAWAQPLAVAEGPLAVEIRGQTYELDAVIVKRADAAGRLPVAILTHGSPRDRAERVKYKAGTMLGQARDMALRGWLAVAFVRRGFGPVNRFVEGYDCKRPDFRRSLLVAAEDIEAVRIAVAARPDADGTRVLGLGVSAGGAAMLAWASTRPAGLAGIVNVSGGTGSFAPNENCSEAQLVAAFGGFGATTDAPSIWFYAANDSFFGPDLVGRMHEAYVRGGGRAERVAFPDIGKDGHSIWSAFAGRERWLPGMDRFLRAHRLPTWNPATAEAAGAEFDAAAKRTLARFLDAPSEKALAVSRAKGVTRYLSGTADLETARTRSLEICRRDAGEPCRVVLENFARP